MTMESWMLILALNVLAWAVMAGSYRNRVKNLEDSQKTNLAQQGRMNDVIFNRLDTHGDDIVSLNTTAKLSMTAKDIDAKYVSKELFNQLERHIDNRFDMLQTDVKSILEYLRGKNNGAV